MQSAVEIMYAQGVQFFSAVMVCMERAPKTLAQVPICVEHVDESIFQSVLFPQL